MQCRVDRGSTLGLNPTTRIEEIEEEERKQGGTALLVCLMMHARCHKSNGMRTLRGHVASASLSLSAYLALCVGVHVHIHMCSPFYI